MLGISLSVLRNYVAILNPHCENLKICGQISYSLFFSDVGNIEGYRRTSGIPGILACTCELVTQIGYRSVIQGKVFALPT